MKYIWEGMKNINNMIIPHAPIFRLFGNRIKKARDISNNPLNILMTYG
tara:strand:+ start:471 stop:614 length:144 start_codon:yes stop_codon:yes gene_type:complete